LKVLFIGFGDIARRSAQLFLAGGWQVTGLRRSEVAETGITMVPGDCRNPALVAGLVAGHDVVIASLTPDNYSEEGYRDAYVVPAKVICDAINSLEQRPRLVLWVSSTSVYGQGTGDWVDENTVIEPVGYSAKALLEAEQWIARVQTPSSVIRFTGIYGPGRERLIRLVREGKCAPAEPVQWSNRIHADDCAGVLYHLTNRFLADNTVAPIYIGSDCEPVPLHEVHRWLADEMGVPFQLSGEKGMARGNRRCSNRLLLDSGYHFKYPTFREGYRALLDEQSPA